MTGEGRSPNPAQPVSTESGGPPPHVGGVPAAYVAALLALPGMGPRRLRRLLDLAPAEQIWASLRSDRGRGLIERAGLRLERGALPAAWRVAAAAIDPIEWWDRHVAAGVRVVAMSDPGYPESLRHDPEPPALLFVRGDPTVLGRTAVALVGTRRATHYGLRLARQWGEELAAAGVVVVSGLAAGIDAAAHQGALAALGGAGRGAPPLAVVGTGVDRVYPRSSRQVWQEVAERGAVVSEVPLGTGPEPWRFPARNRIIAGLSDVVVVIESHAAGGALLTAEDAVARHRVAMAVPGSVHSPASTGTHRLIAEGAGIATCVDDVLLALGSRRPDPPADHRTVSLPEPASSSSASASGEERALLDALGWEPSTVDELVVRTGWSLEVTCGVLDGLLRRNVVRRRGAWITQEGDSNG